MHDIGNAVVGFGGYLTRINRTLQQGNSENTRKLVEFFTTQKATMTSMMGEAKSDAVIQLLSGIALTERSNHEEIGKSISEQQHIINHIQEILDIQRQYINGRESQERKQVNVKDIINDCLSMLYASMEKTGIEVSVNLPDQPPVIKGDRTKLMQVILNILKNSMEAIDITSAEKTIVFNVCANESKVIVEIKDNGKGFDQSVAERLFTRGFTTKSSGSGLGLYNCRAILGSHKGTIDISSEGPGKGTVTIINFSI